MYIYICYVYMFVNYIYVTGICKDMEHVFTSEERIYIYISEIFVHIFVYIHTYMTWVYKHHIFTCTSRIHAYIYMLYNICTYAYVYIYTQANHTLKHVMKKGKLPAFNFDSRSIFVRPLFLSLSFKCVVMCYISFFSSSFFVSSFFPSDFLQCVTVCSMIFSCLVFVRPASLSRSLQCVAQCHTIWLSPCLCELSLSVPLCVAVCTIIFFRSISATLPLSRSLVAVSCRALWFWLPLHLCATLLSRCAVLQRASFFDTAPDVWDHSLSCCDVLYLSCCSVLLQCLVAVSCCSVLLQCAAFLTQASSMWHSTLLCFSVLCEWYDVAVCCSCVSVCSIYE